MGNTSPALGIRVIVSTRLANPLAGPKKKVTFRAMSRLQKESRDADPLSRHQRRGFAFRTPGRLKQVSSPAP
jgi:hypothetical protein